MSFQYSKALLTTLGEQRFRENPDRYFSEWDPLYMGVLGIYCRTFAGVILAYLFKICNTLWSTRTLKF